MHGLLIRITAVAFMFLGVSGANAQPSLTQLRSELISAWLVTVDGENRTRTLKITGVDQKDAGIFPLDAVYGWTDGNQTAVRAEINQTSQERTLLLTTQPGSKIAATQRSDGIFVGTFTSTSGQSKGLKLEKLSEGELLAAQSRLSATMAIEKPAADVPAPCAAFSGHWTAKWSLGGYEAWLWVAKIDAKCSIKYAYLDHARPPKSLATAEIKDGTLSFICNRSTGGTCVFERQGDDLAVSYSNPAGGTNSAVFKKIQ